MGAGGSPATPAGWFTVPDGRTLWWDGAAWHERLPTAPVPRYRPLASLATVVQVLLALDVLASLLVAGIDLQRRALVGRYREELQFLTTSAYQDLQDADRAAQSAATVSGVLLVATIIVFLIWRYRVQANLSGALQVRGLEYTPGWAVGWWFVPFANLVKPKQAMNEAWVASDPTAPSYSVAWRGKAPVILSIWWACWLLANLTVRFGGGSTDTPDGFRTSMLLSVASEGFTIAAAVLLIVIVRTISERQRQRAARLALAAA